MSSYLQAVAVHSLTCALTAGNFTLDLVGLKRVLEMRIYSGTTVPLSSSSSRYYLRADRKDQSRVINIFDAQGNRVYSIERISGYNPVWSLFTYPQRREVATINTGFLARAVDFHNKPGMTHRDLTSEYGLGGCFQSFYVDDGVRYSWSRSSKFLEKVLNPNQRTEEVRTQISKVRLMRQFKLDFEILVDETAIDREVVFSTAFVSILTQWGYGEITNTVGPTATNPVVEAPVANEERQPLVVVVNSENLKVEEIS
ncbi:hypothetical protein PGUG_03306 [Meyerozyma guilliermondii ATCC 6260]|uniref:Uncharacterized protein n=1 Tax=Meyerozyma guilliermondii (strain ATCC 6260 / CBS 566 / DSM 6381 / JCM 1539 / NBRC 10279 / NRRL Y-324) TaxID=294746 RepID=A5DJ55_PICGU|nr:uncharacterized protein PGUG_03306 [Meyerozyma guilliermondii ATCC 6260]EDK39208.2 hypothetical protein PGUG_03306 [Meyerozyma guilliermondii ATCC 6260]